MAKPINGPCYLCGERLAQTRDHVFPRSLFPKNSGFTNLPPQLPACLQCNNGLSQDEELFQQLVVSWRGADTEQGRRLYRTKAGPRLRSPSGLGLRKKLVEHARFAPLVDEVGRVVGAWPVVEMPRGFVDRVLQKIVKGLYYYETGSVLPPDVQIDVGYAGQNPNEFHKVDLPEIRAAAARTVVGSEDTLVYWRAVAADDPAASITWFCFSRWHIFCVTVLPPGLSPGS